MVFRKKGFFKHKTQKPQKNGVRPGFLGPLGYPAMEKNNKTYKNSGPSDEGLQGTNRNVLRWFGHVERMDDDRLLKKVVSARVDGRGARGRPRFGWMDGVKKSTW